MTSEPQPGTSFERSVAIPEPGSARSSADLLRIDAPEQPKAKPDYGTDGPKKIFTPDFGNLTALEHRLGRLGDTPASRADIDLVAEETGWEARLLPLRREPDGSVTHVTVFSRMFTPSEAAALEHADIGNEASVFKLEPVIDERVIGFDVKRPAKGRLLCNAPVPYRELGLLVGVAKTLQRASKAPKSIEKTVDAFVPEIPLTRVEQSFLAKLLKPKQEILIAERMGDPAYERKCRKLQEKTGLTSKGALVAYAVEMGLIKWPNRLEQAELADIHPFQRELAKVAYLTPPEIRKQFGGGPELISQQLGSLRELFGATTHMELTVACAAHGLLDRTFARYVAQHAEALDAHAAQALEAVTDEPLDRPPIDHADADTPDAEPGLLPETVEVDDVGLIGSDEPPALPHSTLEDEQ